MGEKRKRSESPIEVMYLLGLEVWQLLEWGFVNFDGLQLAPIDPNTGNTPSKEAKTDTECPSTPQPLTEANLRILEGVAMGRNKEDTESEKALKSRTSAGALSIKRTRDYMYPIST